MKAQAGGLGGRGITHEPGAYIVGESRVETPRACLSRAGECEGRGSAGVKMYFEWEEPGWQGDGHNAQLLLPILNGGRAGVSMLYAVSRVSDRRHGMTH